MCVKKFYEVCVLGIFSSAVGCMSGDFLEACVSRNFLKGVCQEVFLKGLCQGIS